MPDDLSANEQLLAAVAVGARNVEDARERERLCLAERDQAIVSAVRAGARLDEIAEAAGLTKAAVSLAVRKTLPARKPRGGPYARRRGVGATLGRVQESAGSARNATAEVRDAVLGRDQSIITAAKRGVPVPAIASVMGMQAPAVHTIIRRRRTEPHDSPPAQLHLR
jgi:hypothetical protein